WLKCHHPAAFTCALLNSQPMGFYAPAQLLQDLRRHGATVLPVDVNRSAMECTLEKVAQQPALRLGLCMVKGLSASGSERLITERSQREFSSIEDLLLRTRLNKKDAEALAAADALLGLGGDRYRAFWQVGAWQAPLALETA